MTSFPLLLALCLMASWVRSGVSFSAGPPSSVCGSMTPSHDVGAQTSAPPFALTATPTSVEAGQAVTVTLAATDGGTFKGFLVQARTQAGEPVGDFTQIE